MAEVQAPVKEVEAVKPVTLTFVLSSQSQDKRTSFIPDKPKLDGKGKQTNLGHGRHVILESFTYKLLASNDAPDGIPGHPATLTLSGVHSMGWEPGAEIIVAIKSKP